MDDCARYVHEFQTRYGQTRYAVAKRDAWSGLYVRPLDERERGQSDDEVESARKPSGVQSFGSRLRALQRARHLFYEMDSVAR